MTASQIQRLERLEAELAIRNVIGLYGLAADCGDVKTALNCHWEDAVYVVSNPDAGRDGRGGGDLELRGHEQIAAMLSSERHQSLLPNCAHTVGPLVVKLAESQAQVTGYSRVYNATQGEARLMRLAFNVWTLRQNDGEWKIQKRESRVMGEPAAQTLLKKAISDE